LLALATASTNEVTMVRSSHVAIVAILSTTISTKGTYRPCFSLQTNINNQATKSLSSWRWQWWLLLPPSLLYLQGTTIERQKEGEKKGNKKENKNEKQQKGGLHDQARGFPLVLLYMKNMLIKYQNRQADQDSQTSNI
jgi:hypothetical protein